MANSKISALTSATTPLAGTETLPIVQSSATKQVSVANLTAGRDVTGLSFTGGNVKISGNTVTTTDINGNLTLDPNGSGYTIVAAPTNGTIAQMGNLSSRTFYLKQSNFGGFDNDTLIFESDSGVGQFQWKNSGATLWTMNYTGNLTPAGAAKGVNFTANTPAAGMTSQLLNWYEEGTFTPSLVPSTSGSITLTVAAAKYTRTGRAVTVTGVCEVSSVSSPVGTLFLQGLPFTNSADASSRSAAAIYATGLAITATTSIVGRIIPSESRIRIEKFAAGSTSAMAGDVQANTLIQFNLTYFV